MIRRFATGACFCLMVATPLRAGHVVPGNGPNHYFPHDECSPVEGAGALRQGLIDAARNEDVEGLAKLAAPDVLLDFGGGEGVAELRRRFSGEGGKALWQELRDATGLGCAIGGGFMMMPWFFPQSLGDADPYDTRLVAAADVPLLSSPDPAADVSDYLSWQLVVLDATFDEAKAYQHVRAIGSDKAGFVPTGTLRSQIDYRVVGQRIEGEWKLVAFVAGD
ncbi:MAG: hypothetical protein KDE55_16720 [Novosphingobium sp.]|nr:hypothetical protein [Novosphingobium sp.]